MWFQAEKLHETLKKSSEGFGGVCKKMGMTENGVRNGIKKRTLTVRSFEIICKIIDRHPAEFFDSDDSIPGLISEPDLLQVYRKKDIEIHSIIEMRDVETKFLKGEINRYQEIISAQEKEINELKQKLSDKK